VVVLVGTAEARGWRRAALRSYRGAIVLVTHDEGAVSALTPEKVLLLPDGVEDYWSPELADLVALA
jgi:ATP-binding cassette subfamily F protein 3